MLSTPAAGPGADEAPRVYLMTAGPGAGLTSTFGHSSLWLENAETGRMMAYSFGHSRPDAPFSAAGLLLGSLDSGGTVLDAMDMWRRYNHEGRLLRLQRLGLSGDEVRVLERTLSHELARRTPYVFSEANCTTRLRNALDVALGGRLRAAADSLPASGTLRSRVAAYGGPGLHLAADLLLSAPADQPITAWEAMFLPDGLHEGLHGVRLPDGEGQARRLVAAEHTIGQPSVGARAPKEGPTLTVIGILIGAVLAGSAHAARSGRAWARLVFAIVGGSWSLLAGMAGVLIAALWAFSGQGLLQGNENLLLANPLLLLLGMAVWGSAYHPGRARPLALLIGLVTLIGPLVGHLAGSGQANGPVLALAIPAHLGLTWGIWIKDGPSAPPRSRA